MLMKNQRYSRRSRLQRQRRCHWPINLQVRDHVTRIHTCINHFLQQQFFFQRAAIFSSVTWVLILWFCVFSFVCGCKKSCISCILYTFYFLCFWFIIFTLRPSEAAAQCIVIGPVCGFVCVCVFVCVFVCLWVCYHDNSILHASILRNVSIV